MKKCINVPLNIYIFGILLFILSEIILFIFIFWSLFHYMFSSDFLIFENIFTFDPCELTYCNTLILSISASYLGFRGFNYFGNYHIVTIFFSLLFIFLQIKEFRNLSIYINDSVFGCIFFSLIGLHFWHVIIGLIILSLNNFHFYYNRILFDCIFIIHYDLYFIFLRWRTQS